MRWLKATTFGGGHLLYLVTQGWKLWFERRALGGDGEPPLQSLCERIWGLFVLGERPRDGGYELSKMMEVLGWGRRAAPTVFVQEDMGLVLSLEDAPGTVAMSFRK